MMTALPTREDLGYTPQAMFGSWYAGGICKTALPGRTRQPFLGGQEHPDWLSNTQRLPHWGSMLPLVLTGKGEKGIFLSPSAL